MRPEPETPATPPLRRYQRDGVAFLNSRRGALLADEMGLGKTAQVIRALRHEQRRALLVVPSALRLNWERELERWAPELTVRRIEGPTPERLILYALPVDVLLATYEQIRSDALTLGNRDFDIVILDEAQRIKNKNAASAFACKLLRRTTAWALTGTPVENRMDDLLSLFEFVSPGLLQRNETLSTLRAKIAPYMLRRAKSDVAADLPPIIRQELRLQLGGTQAAAYDDLWDQRTQTQGGAASYFRLITRLKRLCNVHTPTDTSVKWDALRLLLEAQTRATDKVLVFSQYVTTLAWLNERIELPSRLYHGAMTEQQRDENLRWFRQSHGPGVLLTSIRAGGVGLNLNEASTVVLFDRWWNPAVEEQAINRAHRLGRVTPLHVVSFIVENTIEERIRRVLARKESLASMITGARLPHHAALTIKDLEEILGLKKENT